MTDAADGESPAALAETLPWLSGADSPTGRRVLDVRAASRTLLSMSEDAAAAMTLISDLPETFFDADPAPENPVSIPVRWSFTTTEMSRVQRGFPPGTMEDKWRIVTRPRLGGLRAYFLRSWTNRVVATLDVDGAMGTVLTARQDTFAPEATVRAILDGYLLDGPCVVPATPDLGTDKLSLMSFGISVAGRRCDFVEPTSAAVASSDDDGRRVGALLGLAVGDALGAAVEFKAPGTFPIVSGYRDGGPHGLGPGEWTDDTSMALALADSLRLGTWDVSDQASRYLDWWRNGAYSVNGRCFDIGIATRSALARIAAGAPATAGGDDADSSSGNGSIMRLAPVPMRYLHLFPDDTVTLARYAAESSTPTHRSPKCLSACRYLALILAGLMHGLPREEVLSPNWSLLRALHAAEPLEPSILHVAEGSFRRNAPPVIRGSGYVVESLEAALWAFHGAATFRDAVLAAVNLGHDADTTGAICGQLAGAYFGKEGIPADLLDGLARREMIEELGLSLGATTQGARIADGTRALRFQLADGSKPPAPRCYWVVPNRFLAGAYPGHPDRAAHAERISRLWSSGVRSFVSLMEEHETNNTGKAFKAYADEVRALAGRDGAEAHCRRFAIRDISVPSVVLMREVLDFVDTELAANRGVYVHCFGGIGRTGTVVGCWLIRHGFATPGDVETVLARLRCTDAERASRRSPETEEQRQFVASWRG
jgi:ADP-ribosylglycohydrolase